MYQASLFESLLTVQSTHMYVPLYYGKDANQVKQYMGKDILSLQNPFLNNRLILKNSADRLIGGALKTAGIDLIHGTAHFTVNGFEDRTVLTIHDLIYLRDPDYYNKRFVDLLLNLAGKVRKIIAVSRTTKLEILDQFPFLPESKVEVVYEGVRSDCVRIKDDLVLKDFKNRFFGDENFKYILYVGSFTKRKNIINIIKAYAQFRKKHHADCKLVLVGKPADIYQEAIALIGSLGLKDSIIIKGYVEDSNLSALYSGAEVFIFPSYYEGFGLPVIEAMQCGCPCIISNVSSLKELFTGAALAVDPHSVAEIAGAIEKFLRDPMLRNKYRELGFSKAKEFNWKKTAEDTQKVYESVY